MVRRERLTKGLWWDRAWSLVEGCSKVSPGCDHCWSEKQAVLRVNNPMTGHRYRGLVEGGRWTGKVQLMEKDLEKPLHVKKPTVWAVWNDLFHPLVPFWFVDSVIVIIEKTPRHTYLILTKRHERALEYDRYALDWEWPANVYLGLTVCNQIEYDSKMPHFIEHSCERKFLSVEPCLGLIDPTPPQYRGTNVNNDVWLQELWGVVLGGETGRKARPMHQDWARVWRYRCAKRTDMGRPWPLPFFFKKWGEWVTVYDRDRDDPDWGNCPKAKDNSERYINLTGGHGFHGDRVCFIQRKKAAGRLLDGREWNDLPW